MKKIAILGCENSHADAFITCIKNQADFSDVEVVGVYSDNPEASEKLKVKHGVPVLATYDEAVGKIDGLIVTARHGDSHYKFAKPYIESGIPMFIDKPITITEADAVEFMKGLKAKGVKVCGGSSLRQDENMKALKKESEELDGGKTVGGFVRAPYMSDSPHGGFYFYSQHLAEMVCEIFGRFPLSVTAKQNGEQINLLFHYEDYDVAGLYCDKKHVYFASRMSETKSSSRDIVFTEEWYYNEFREFYELLGGAAQPLTYKEFISPVFILNAIERALKSGLDEKIEYAEV